MELCFNTNGNDKQREAVHAWNDSRIYEIVYGGSKGSGKSYLGASLIFGDALMYPGTFYFIARKKLNDLQRFTMPSIAEVFGHWGLQLDKYATYNGQLNFYQLHNGSRVYLLDAKYLPSDPEYTRFGSMQMTRGWIEEAGEFEESAKANLQASVGRWKNEEYGLPPKTLMTCNPTKNFLFFKYYLPFRDDRLPHHVAFIRALPTDNKKLPAEYLSHLHLILTDAEIKRLVYGLWEFGEDDGDLVSYEAIIECFTNHAAGNIRTQGVESALSTDLARQGRDLWTVFHFSYNTATLARASDWAKLNEIEYELKLLEALYHVKRCNVVADSDGLGQYLGDYMNGIVEFRNGARARNPEKYANAKTELAYELAGLINNRQFKISCPPEFRDAIIADLGMLKVDNVSVDTAPRKLVSKKKMKELLGRSPDFLDPLIYGMVFRHVTYIEGTRIKKKSKPGINYSREKSVSLQSERFASEVHRNVMERMKR